MVDVALAGLIWLVVITAIWRGYRRERSISRFALRTWIIFIFIAFVFTFRSPSLEFWIDARFGGHPVTFWLNALCTLGAASVYTISVLRFGESSADLLVLEPRRKLVGVVWLVTLGVSLILAMSFWGFISAQQARYGMRLLLETYVLFLVALILIPINVGLFQRETVEPMKVKHAAVIAVFATYAAGALVALLFIPPILMTGEVNSGMEIVPRVQIGTACLIVMLLPHKRLRTLLLPLHLYRYRRIAALERFISERVGGEPEPLRWRRILFPQAVEIATYVAVINILDRYRCLRVEVPEERKVYRKISALLPGHRAYDDLVVALSRISI